jgi:hypothetical protein
MPYKLSQPALKGDHAVSPHHGDDCTAGGKKQRRVYTTTLGAPSGSPPAPAHVPPTDNVYYDNNRVRELARKHATPNRHQANESQHWSSSTTADLEADGITTIHGMLHRLPQPLLTESVDSSAKEPVDMQLGSTSADGAADSDSSNQDVAWDRVFRALSGAISGSSTAS